MFLNFTENSATFWADILSRPEFIDKFFVVVVFLNIGYTKVTDQLNHVKKRFYYWSLTFHHNMLQEYTKFLFSFVLVQESLSIVSKPLFGQQIHRQTAFNDKLTSPPPPLRRETTD